MSGLALGIVTGVAVIVIACAAFVWFHWPLKGMRDPKVRAERALRAMQESADRYERNQWRNWLEW